MAAAQFTGAEINHVLRMVAAMSDNGDVQLSILTHALVIAARSCVVDRQIIHEQIDKVFNRHDALVLLTRAN